MSRDIRQFYVTPDPEILQSGMLVRLGKNDDQGRFGISVHNGREGMDAFVVVDRAELMRVRDAITKELAS